MVCYHKIHVEQNHHKKEHKEIQEHGGKLGKLQGSYLYIYINIIYILYIYIYIHKHMYIYTGIYV